MNLFLIQIELTTIRLNDRNVFVILKMSNNSYVNLCCSVGFYRHAMRNMSFDVPYLKCIDKMLRVF